MLLALHLRGIKLIKQTPQYFLFVLFSNYHVGNTQYGQQQDAYQGPPPQQGYPPQQQYPGQQGYPGQQQGYGPSQGGPGPQYPNYPQGQGQQYGGYRPAQPGPPQPPQQRPYGYDQVSYLASCMAAPLCAHS